MLKALLFSCLVLLSGYSMAASTDFLPGPAISHFGKYAEVNGVAFDKNQHFYVAFDVAKQAKVGELNRQFDTLARFINMHVAHGLPRENIHLALVVHGKAGFDLLNNKAYLAQYQTKNGNHQLLNALMDNQVAVYLCGQSAACYDIEPEMLQKGVNMALSAMTAHALLQQKGYSLNPF